jgi:hypothetical protein
VKAVQNASKEYLKLTYKNVRSGLVYYAAGTEAAKADGENAELSVGGAVSSVVRNVLMTPLTPFKPLRNVMVAAALDKAGSNYNDGHYWSAAVGAGGVGLPVLRQTWAKRAVNEIEHDADSAPPAPKSN